jgi:peptide/nickel transport system substrate-binding protein
LLDCVEEHSNPNYQKEENTMNKKLSRIMVVVFLLSALLGACAPAPVTPTPVTIVNTVVVPATAVPDAAMLERQKTVIFDIDSGSVADPELWNPFAASARLDQGLMQAMAEPLFILNMASPTGEVINWLGESMTYNTDATVWTIKLRQGITWSDGTPLNADDFLFTVNLGIQHTDLSNMPSFNNVASVDKIDDLTLQFTLKKGDYRFGPSSFVAKTSTPFFIVPQHIWEGQDPTTFTNYDPAKGWPIFSGPYLLKSVSGTEFEYVHNENWWGAKAGLADLPKPEKLIWVAYGTVETRTVAMAKHDLDSLTAIDLGSFLALKQLNPTTIAWTQELPYAWSGDPCTRSLNFNLTKEPWNDPDMRLAVNHAIDRSKIVDIAYQGTTTIAQTFLPNEEFKSYVDAATAAGLFTKYPVDAYDPQAAKAIIESKGYVLNAKTGYYEKGGKPLTMTISNFSDMEMNNATAALVEQLQAVGINATEDTQPIPTFINNLTNAGFDTYYFFICGPLDLWSKMDSFSTRNIPAAGQPSSGFYANTERWNSANAQAYSDIVAQMGNLPPDSPQMTTLFLSALEYWLKDMPALPIVQSAKLVPFDETYWTNWPTADNAYIAPLTSYPSTLVILTHLKPAGK